jgi:DNA-binding NarL/FixJ family response regulator
MSMNSGDARVDRVKVFAVVEDEPDMQLLIRTMLGKDPRLVLDGQAASADEALELLDTIEPGLIILDHGLHGSMTGLEAAPMLKARAPLAKILLFTAFDLHREAEREPAVDAFLRKDMIMRLLPTAQRLLDLPPLEDAS